MGQPNPADEDASGKEFLQNYTWPEEDRHLFTSGPMEWWVSVVSIVKRRAARAVPEARAEAAAIMMVPPRPSEPSTRHNLARRGRPATLFERGQGPWHHDVAHIGRSPMGVRHRLAR